MNRLKKWWTGEEVKTEFGIGTPDLQSLIYDGTLKVYSELFREMTPDIIRDTLPQAVGCFDEFFDMLLVPSEDVNALRALAEQPQQDDPETFIRNLTFSATNDIELTIKAPGKKPTMGHSFEAMKFRSSTTDEWKELLKIVKAPFPVFKVGTTRDRKEYDKRNNLLKRINQKIIEHLQDYFKITVPEGFKAYALDKSMGAGVYTFIFKTEACTANEDERGITLDQLERLAEMYHETDDSIRRKAAFNKFVELGEKAVDKKWIERDMLAPMIREKDDLRYEKLE